MRIWRNGSRAVLRTQCPKGREGSSPSARTIWERGQTGEGAPFKLERFCGFESRRSYQQGGNDGKEKWVQEGEKQEGLSQESGSLICSLNSGFLVTAKELE